MTAYQEYAQFIALGAVALLYQGLVVMHELVHSAIFYYFGVASKIEIGLFCGMVTPEPFIMDTTARSTMYLAHAINEIVLPIEILLIIIIGIMVYNAIKGGE